MVKIFQNLKRNSIFLFLFVFIITSVSAIQTFQQDSEVVLCRAVRQDDALPSGATCNITISFSNGTRLVDFLAMDDLTDRFCINLTSNDTSIKGIYNYEVTCIDGSNNASLVSEYLVNLGGIEPSQSRTDALSRTIYIFFGLAFAAFLSLFWTKKMPYKASLFLIMIWFILMGINSAYISIQDEVVNTDIENFFSFFLTISFWANYVIIVSISVIWAITFIVSLFDKHQRSLQKNYG